MKNIKIAKKNEMMYEMANMIMPSAISFYGEKYASIIINAVQNSHLYEWSCQSEDIISKDINRPKEELKLYKNQKGYHTYNPSFVHVIVIDEKMSIKDKLFTLTHELFGHAVISEIDPYIEKDGISYTRNGVALIQNDDKRNKQYIEINEGIVEYITDEIIKKYDSKCSTKDLKKYNSEYYAQARIFARYLFEILGKENMLEVLVLNKRDIRYLYNPNDLDEWDRMANELKKVDPYLGKYLNDLRERKNKNEEVYNR